MHNLFSLCRLLNKVVQLAVKKRWSSPLYCCNRTCTFFKPYNLNTMYLAVKSFFDGSTLIAFRENSVKAFGWL